MAEHGDEKHRGWIAQVALAVQNGAAEAETLQYFLDRLAHFNGVLTAAMYLLDSQDYEKRPWDDESDVLRTALGYSSFAGHFPLLLEVMAEGDLPARARAAKWLPAYAADSESMPVLAGLLADPAPEVRRWAAIHLSRVRPETPGSVPVLIEALHAKWNASIRLLWDFGCTGSGEAAEALYHLGPRAEAALPHLCEAIRRLGRYQAYDAELAARAVWKIAGEPAAALGWLEPLASGGSMIDRVLQEIASDGEGEPDSRGPVWPPRHASFVARFIRRPGDYRYWRDRPAPDPRGAF